MAMSSTIDRRVSPCKYYSNKKEYPQGCTSEGCFNLHICWYYWKGTCRHHKACAYSHDLTDAHCAERLQAKGYDIKGTADQVLQRVKRGNAGAPTNVRHSSSASLPRATGSSSRPTSSTQSAGISETMCYKHLLSVCRARPCGRLHCDLPYLWRFDGSSSGWNSFPEEMQLALEQEYCKPCMAPDLSSIYGSRCLVDFNHMTMNTSQRRSNIRRISVLSKAPDLEFATKHLWYWHEHEQKQYRPFDAREQVEIENAYERDPKCEMPVTRGQHRYMLSLNNMTQTNTATNMVRAVLRRPKLMTLHAVQAITRQPREARSVQPLTGTIIINYPRYWQQQIIAGPSGYEKIPVTTDTAEYQSIVDSFRHSMGRKCVSVKSLYRIQNPTLWENYDRKRTKLSARLSRPSSQLERLLYHGTATLNPILSQGLDVRISGSRTGAKYGNGSYFSCDATISHSYQVGNQLLVCRVLVGDYTQGTLGLPRPPVKPNGDLYDTCVDNIIAPTIYVTFDKEDSYPNYVIEYTT